MQSAYLATCLVGAAIVASFVLAPDSVAQDATGVWVNPPEACDTVFTRSGGQIDFSPRADFYGSGFIIKGNVIRGKMATCKVQKTTRQGNIVTITATCATDVMVGDSTFQLKVDDHNTLVRIVPGSPELDTKYVRCPTK